MAASARTEPERAAWLKLAESWLRLSRTLETHEESEDSIALQFEPAAEFQPATPAPVTLRQQ
jgi:hypothetical protein